MLQSRLSIAASSLLAFAMLANLGGCASMQATPQPQRADLAWRAEDTRNFARFVGEFVRNHQPVTAGGAGPDKSALLARAEILQQHAQVQAERVAEFVADGSRAAGTTLQDLQARDDGLRRERAALNHEWDVWQVQLGIKQAADTELSYVPATGTGC